MTEWVQVAKTHQMVEDEPIIVEVDGVMVAVYKHDGEFIAIEDACPHDGSEIASGCVVKGILECPHHGATFDLKSGDFLSPPAFSGLEKMQVRVVDEKVEVRDPRWD